MEECVRIKPERLEKWTIMLMEEAGVPRHEAEEVVRHLIFADLRGQHHHGTRCLKAYLDQVEKGTIARSAHVRVVRETLVSALIDGGGSFGHIACRKAADMAVTKARAAGVSMVGVRHSNPGGCMAYYTLLMAGAGLVGLACTSAEAHISMAIPGGKRPPLVFEPVTGREAPLEVLSSILTGALVAPELPRLYEQLGQLQEVSHFFLAFRPDLFCPLEQFTSRVNQIVAEVQARRRVLDQALLSGDLEQMQEEENRRLGIPVSADLRREFAELAERYRVDLPWELRPAAAERSEEHARV